MVRVDGSGGSALFSELFLYGLFLPFLFFTCVLSAKFNLINFGFRDLLFCLFLFFYGRGCMLFGVLG